jgi:hypothetical protein
MKKIHKLITPKNSIHPDLCKMKEQGNDYFLTDSYKGMVIHKDKNVALDTTDVPMIQDEHYPDLYAVIPKDDEYDRVISFNINNLYDLLSAIKELKKLNKDKDMYSKITMYIPKIDSKPVKIVDNYQTSIVMPLNK